MTSSNHDDQSEADLTRSVGPKRGRSAQVGEQIRAPSPDALPSQRPERIATYRILGELGEGGMGVVYLAEQSEPIHRRVALKVIKRGMDTGPVIARFESERQALALMNHPNVAKVLDAGATDDGRPYFVMDYVQGESITQYCDRHCLNTKERLELFILVCEAVQHAHHKGIIHRDLKPSNVLVEVRDSRPIPKVIDFGVAKATQQRLTERTLFTEYGQLIGTPEYMSPEQAEMTALDIDTRTDIYSLGVILYELLTGVLPFDAVSLRRAALVEIQRIIREFDPPKPSTRLSGLGDSTAAVTKHRRTELGSLARLLRGDLDWITMKALEKDRTRRYATAAEFAADVSRHMAYEPVLAGPPAPGYRIRKFVRRHRVAVATGSAVIAALVVGIIGTTWGFARALNENRRAQAAEDKAQRRADELEEVAQFQARQLSGVNPELMGERLRAALRVQKRLALESPHVSSSDVEAGLSELDSNLEGVSFTNLALEVLDENIFKRASATIESEFSDQPLVKARLSQTLADTLRAIGLYDQAMRPQDEALRIRHEKLGDDDLNTLISLDHMGNLLQARGDLPRARDCYRRNLETSRQVLGNDHPHTLDAILDMGDILVILGDYAAAEPLLREAVDRHLSVLGDQHPRTLDSLASLGGLLMRQGKLADAEPIYRVVLEGRRRVLGERDPATAKSKNNMGLFLQARGKLAEAEPYYGDALETFRRILGNEHPETLIAINNMGLLLNAMGRISDARPYFREASDGLRRILVGNHVLALKSIANLASSLQAQGEYDQAARIARQALDGFRETLGDEHPDTLRAMNNMGSLLQVTGKLDEAERLYRACLELRRRILINDHPDTLMSVDNLGTILLDRGRLREADAYFREAFEGRRRVLGNDHPDTLTSLNGMGRVLQGLGKLDEAEKFYQKALDGRREKLGTGHPETLQSMNDLGSCLLARGRRDEAEGYFREVLAGRQRTLGNEHPDTLASINNMGTVLFAQGRLSEAEQYFRLALDINRRVHGDDHPETLVSIGNVGAVLNAQGRNAEAEPFYRGSLERHRRVLGDLHPNTLTAINNMGYLLRAEGKLLAAEPFYREAMEGRRATLGDDHPDTLRSINNLGALLVAGGRHEEAVAVLAPAEPLVRAHLPRLLGRFLTHLGRARSATGSYGDAERVLLESQAILAKNKQVNRSHYIDALQSLVSLYDRWDRAEPQKGYDAETTKWRRKLAQLDHAE